MLCYHGIVFPFSRRKQQQVIIFNESLLLLVLCLAVHLERTGGKWRLNYNRCLMIFFALFVAVNTVYILWRYMKILNGTDGKASPRSGKGGVKNSPKSKMPDRAYNSYA